MLAITKPRLFILACLKPILVVSVRAMVYTHCAARASLFLKAFQLLQRSQQRPAPPIAQAKDPPAPPDHGLEGKPSLHHTLLLGRPLSQRPTGRLGFMQRGGQHFPDRLTTLQRNNIPGKGNQIAPVTFVVKERNRPGEIGLGQCAV